MRLIYFRHSLTTGVVTARCGNIVCTTRCRAGAISLIVEWTTVTRGGHTATLTNIQTGAVTYCISIFIKNMSVVYRIIALHAQSASLSIVTLGLLLTTVVHMEQSLLVLMLNTLAGGDWSSSPTVAKFPDVHLNVNCAVKLPLAVLLVYLTATDTCLY